MADDRMSWHVKVSVAGLALSGAFLVFAIAFLTERNYGSEEITLHNIPYMYQHYNKASLAVYQYWYNASYDIPFLHPPTHYVIIGALLKLSLGLYYSEAIPLVVMSALTLSLMYFSPLPIAIRCGLLSGFVSWLGFCTSFGVSDYAFHLRPDAHLTVAWIAGLIALQSARFSCWDAKLLGLGGFLLAYSSGIHYFGTFGFAGLGVYTYLIYRDPAISNKARWKAVLVMAAGACVFGLPYVYLFVTPRWEYIRFVVQATQATRDIRSRIASNFDIYAQVSAQWANSYPFPWLCYAAPVRGALALKVPPFIVAAGILMLWRSTRAMALASLPIPLFVFLASSRKLWTYNYPEFLLLLVAVWTAIAVCLQGLGTAITSVGWRWLPITVAAGLLSVTVVLTTPPLRKTVLSTRPKVHELEMARYLARSILGRDAAIASQHNLWYVSGAGRWFDLTSDLLFKLPTIELRKYFSVFDAFASTAGSDLSLNYAYAQRTVNENTLYADGTADLRAFYFTRSGAVPGWFWFSAGRDSVVQGYFWRDGTLYKFVQDARGDYVLAALVGRLGAVAEVLAKNNAEAVAQAHLLLPLDRGTTRAVSVLIAPYARYGNLRPHLLSANTVRDELRGVLTEVDARDLATYRAIPDPPIEFVRSYDEVLARSGLCTSVPAIGSLSLLDTTPLKAVFHGGKFDIAPDASTIRIQTPSIGSDWLLVTDEMALPGSCGCLVSFELEIGAGGLAVYALEDGHNTPFFTMLREFPQPVRSERFLVAAGSRPSMRLLVSAYNPMKPRKTEALIRKLWIICS